MCRIFGRIKYKFRDFRVGIRNLKRWFPIIWADRDFDYSFLLYIMKFKIQNMQSRTTMMHYEGQELVADEQGAVVDLLDYLIGDEGYVQDSFSNREVYEGNKKKLWDLINNFEAWWD